MKLKSTCPKCKGPLEVELADLYPGATITCPGCGAVGEAKEGSEDGRAIQRELDELRRMSRLK